MTQTAARIRSAAAFGLTCAAFAWMHRDDFADLFDPWRIQEDARQWMGPLWRLHDPSLLVGDEMTGYMAARTPDGYEWLYLLGSGLDPVQYGKLLALALLLLTLALVWLTVVHVSRSVTAGMAAVALALVFWRLVTDTAGGLPRSFAPPLVAACAWALVTHRRWLLAGLPVLAGLFYPPICLVLGGVLALHCLGLSDRRPADLLRRRPDRNRLAVLALAGALTGLAVLPQARVAGAYGDPMDATARIRLEAHPEYVGTHGSSPLNRRAESWQRIPRMLFDYPQFQLRFLAPSVVGRLPGAPLVISLLLSIGAAAVLLAQPRARPLLILLAAAGAAGAIAVLVYPRLYFPDRHLDLPVKVLMLIAVPLIPVAAGDRLPRGARSPRIGAAVLNLGIVGLAGAAAGAGDHGSPLYGTVVVPQAWRQPYEHLQTLPADALIAGWNDTTGSGGIDNGIVLLTGRRALVGEIDFFHRDVVLEASRRIDALIDAYFSSRPGALRDLRGDFDVTHLLVDRAHFGRTPPTSDEPYRTWARRRWTQLRETGAASAAGRCRRDGAATVYDDGRFFMLDLRAVAEGACRRRR